MCKTDGTHKQIENKIKEKFTDIEKYTYVQNINKIRAGSELIYTDIKLKELSPHGTVMYKTYYPKYENKKKIIKYIYLWNKDLKIKWKICAKKCYIFETNYKVNDAITGK